jgi:hypothetical protein
VSDEPGDQGYLFQAASIHAQGYYQGEALRQLLWQTMHRADPGAPGDRLHNRWF